MSDGKETVIEVNSLTWDGVEWSALHYVHPIIEASGLKFEMSVQNWTPEGYRGIGFEYDSGKRVAYLADGNIARLTRNDTGVEVPEAIRVVEKREE